MKTEIIEEIAKHKRPDGLILPIDIFETAKDPQNVLHKYFVWDKEEAFLEANLLRARNLIRVCVEKLPTIDRKMKVFVSLSQDRRQPNGGYRSMNDVLTNDDLRHALLMQAVKEFELWQSKYQEIQELAQVFESMQTVKRTVTNAQKEAALSA